MEVTINRATVSEATGDFATKKILHFGNKSHNFISTQYAAESELSTFKNTLIFYWQKFTNGR